MAAESGEEGEEEEEEEEEGSSEGEEEEEQEELTSAEDMLDPLWLVRDSASFIAAHAQHVRLDLASVRAVAAQWAESGLERCTPVFDRALHFVDEARPDLTAQYLFVLDTLNWCFWPDLEGAQARAFEPGAARAQQRARAPRTHLGLCTCADTHCTAAVSFPPRHAPFARAVAPSATEAFEYADLARSLKASVEADPGCISAERLKAMDAPTLRALLAWPRALPCEEERVRVLRQSAAVLAAQFGGSAASLVAAARGSASVLVSLVVAHFPAFRDHAMYRGRQVFFHKRAQIFVGDVYGAFGGEGLGSFADIGSLTMFADYRVPVVLRQLGMLRYTPALAAQLEAREVLPHGSEAECEIRGCAVAAVEALRTALAAAAARRNQAGPTSLTLDWHLWEVGEASRLTSAPHHRTLSIYY